MKAKTPLQALVEAVHEVQPAVLADGVRLNTNPLKPHTVELTFVMSPELVAAWGEKCAALCTPMPVLHTGEAVIPKANPIPQPQG